MLEPTYTMSENGPPAMTWEVYADRVIKEWRTLLNSADASDERVIQNFLQLHPCLVPGSHDSIPNAGSGHTPFPAAVIAQPPLQGLTRRIPDFMWLASDSAKLCPILIEIESPTKRWFKDNGVPTAEFTQALDQLSEWKVWFDHAGNREIFRDFYAIPDDLWRRRAFKPKGPRVSNLSALVARLVGKPRNSIELAIRGP